MKSLEQDLLKELIHYDPDTGVFTWRKKPSKNIKAGAQAGKILNPQSYIQVSINYRKHYLHRLAWIYMYGSIPEGFTIEHNNRVKGDNRIKNLKLATCAEQQQNRTVNKNNISGYAGVHFHKPSNKWRARIMVNRKEIYLGLFDTPEAANSARIKAKAELHTFNPVQR